MLHSALDGEVGPNRDRSAQAEKLYNPARRKNQSLKKLLFEDEC